MIDEKEKKFEEFISDSFNEFFGEKFKNLSSICSMEELEKQVERQKLFKKMCRGGQHDKKL